MASNGAARAQAYAREWVLILFGCGLIAWEAAVDLSSNKVVYAVGLFILQLIPWSVAERLLGQRIALRGDDDDPPPPRRTTRHR